MNVPCHLWPDTFDFETDPVCQTLFKPFIEEQMVALKAYDSFRPDNITYIFHEHTKRVADNVRAACLYIGLSKVVAQNMYWASLPHDIGKMSLPAEIWDTDEKPTETLKKHRRTHTSLGADLVHERFPDTDHPFKDLMIDIMLNHHEQMDGHGTHNIPGNQLSLPVKLVSIVEAYDGWRIYRPHFGERDISPPGVISRMREEKMHMFDPDLFEPFAEMILSTYKDTITTNPMSEI